MKMHCWYSLLQVHALFLKESNHYITQSLSHITMSSTEPVFNSSQKNRLTPLLQSVYYSSSYCCGRGGSLLGFCRSTAPLWSKEEHMSHNSHRSVDLSSSAKSTYCYKQLERMTGYGRNCLKTGDRKPGPGDSTERCAETYLWWMICKCEWFRAFLEHTPGSSHRPFPHLFLKLHWRKPKAPLSSDLLFQCVLIGRWEHAERQNWQKATEEAPGDRDSPASGNTSSLLYSRSGFITQDLGGLAWS